MPGRTIVIAGGGIGGLVAAGELRRRLSLEHRIVLIERNHRHAFAPSFLWLMTGERRLEQVTREVHQLVPRGVDLLLAEIQGVDLGRRRIETNIGTVEYDYLIMAAGAELAPESVPGMDQTAHSFYTLEGAMRLGEATRSFGGGKIALVVSALPYKCPGAPHEAAMLLSRAARRSSGRAAEVHLFTPEPQPMPVAGPELGRAVEEMLADRGIVFHPLHKLVTVDPASRRLAFDGKDPFVYDLFVVIPPHQPPRFVRDSGLAGDAGWIPVERGTLHTRHENVYAVGDVAAISIPGRWKPDVPLMLPKAGVFAHAQAIVVARRIVAEIAGETPQALFCGDGFCMLEAGSGVAGFAFGNFFAEPTPQVYLRRVGRTWRLGKVLFEKWWLLPPGIRREVMRLGLSLGAKGLRVPAEL